MLRKALLPIAAFISYALLALYLYYPHFEHFGRLDYLYPVNSVLAGLGCFVLSRRWISSFVASLLAGAVYGFGPFLLAFARFHATAGFLAASVPWFLCPAVYLARNKWRTVAIPLSLLPFLAIVAFFAVSIRYRLFAVPTQAKPHLLDLATLLAPLVMAGRSQTLVAFYHIPLAALLVGLLMLFAAKKVGIIAMLLAPIILSFCDSLNAYLNVSPVAWLTVPLLVCSILIGLGTQGLISAADPDRRWILLDAVFMAALAIVSLLLSTKYFQFFASLADNVARLFVRTGLMYTLAAIAVTIVYLMARTKLRLRVFRIALICSAMAVDIIGGAAFIVDRLL